MTVASVGAVPGKLDCAVSVAMYVAIAEPRVFLASVAVPCVTSANPAATCKDNCAVFPSKVPSRVRTRHPPPVPVSDAPSIHAKTADSVSQSKA
eukprot:CAMPEP_0198288806 /NCGR_PEP_ID=MMETSP1449-20131203/7199_1 /TAXON_ID=420275 /ORGANISM="Attheya septentrionalis, Strain CCMP2084" /LENGTH=93 /DNA_ID=CAMNT_0043987021 /DNA_START=251 /DNA_END=532 /DNA_ORIENTATION=-